MSQQEIMPEPQSNKERLGNEEDIHAAQPYYWSTQPKEEPASGHDESLMQNDYASGYQSQNETVYSYPENNTSAKATADFAQAQTHRGSNNNSNNFRVSRRVIPMRPMAMLLRRDTTRTIRQAHIMPIIVGSRGRVYHHGCDHSAAGVVSAGSG